MDRRKFVSRVAAACAVAMALGATGWSNALRASEARPEGATDGAAMASCSNANPSLTYMALTARACAHAVDELKRRNI